MLSVSDATRVYLACGSTDMRKSIDGLAALVTHVYSQDLFAGSLFVFCNRGRDKLKILTWDHNGFWLYYRRLERGRFQWPSQTEPVHTTRELLKERDQLKAENQWLKEQLGLVKHRLFAPSADMVPHRTGGAALQ